ncbi:ABC-type multidrug transport system, ATPase component [bacterium A37T11]|nr:ABC-type multidrug transport system, ATPase component [bacterium A37T11]
MTKLIINQLSKTYQNGHRALDEVSLEIGKGMFGLLGQNGAGKSTLMRTLATLQDADAGTVFLDGLDVLKQPQEVRKVLGYLPQDFGVYPNVSAHEMLAYIASMKGVRSGKGLKEAVDELLARVNLYDVRHKKLGTYSGGMKQRFGIAQALIGQPMLIIVDEPTAGLDPWERNRFYNLLSQIGENTIVILSTHIVEDVATLCRDMAIMGQGKVLLTGKPQQLEQTLLGHLWQKPVSRDELERCQQQLSVISSHFHAGQLHVTVLANEAPDSQFISKPPTLEDVYFTQL